MNSLKLEIACFTIHSALNAAKAGADRIEFCSDYEAGGISPHLKDVKFIRSKTNNFLSVMVRPRGGDFVYSENEFEEMKRSILELKPTKVDAVVFGILDPEHKIDMERNSELVNLAEPMKCIFHRAFDEVKFPLDSLEKVIDCGFDYLLTSGGNQKQTLNPSAIKNLITHAQSRISIIAGGGIRSGNIEEVIKESGAKYFHSSAIINDGRETANPEEIKKLQEILWS
ncbi:MAG: copper homeostasis protein CutC [Bacteroidia bacterium]